MFLDFLRERCLHEGGRESTDEGKLDALHVAAEDRAELVVGHGPLVPTRPSVCCRRQPKVVGALSVVGTKKMS